MKFGQKQERTYGVVGLEPGQQILGRIRLGIKKETATGKTHPVDVDHFVFTETLLRDYPQFTDIFGEKPTALYGLIAPVDRKVTFDYALERYTTRGLQCRGDGVTANERMPTGGHKKIACPCHHLDDKTCKLSGDLLLMFPQISVSGFFAIETHSIYNVRSILGALDFIEGVCGRVGGQRVRLRRGEKKMTYTDDKNEQRTSTHWLLTLEMLGMPKQGESLMDGWPAPVNALAAAPQYAALPPATHPAPDTHVIQPAQHASHADGITDADPRSMTDEEKMLAEVGDLDLASDIQAWVRSRKAMLDDLETRTPGAKARVMGAVNAALAKAKKGGAK
jgi:hypothetical protein